MIVTSGVSNCSRTSFRLHNRFLFFCPALYLKTNNATEYTKKFFDNSFTSYDPLEVARFIPKSENVLKS